DRDRLQANAHAVQYPIGAEDEFRGIIDLVKMKTYLYNDDLVQDVEEIEIPEEYADKAQEMREALIEGLADVKEEVMEEYIGGEELKDAIRKATCDVEFFPVFCGTAFKNKGVQLLLDGIIEYLPSPLEVKPIVGHMANDPEEEYVAKPGDDEPFTALAFKVMTDP